MLIEHVQGIGESNIGNVEIRRQTEEENRVSARRGSGRYAPEEHRNAKGAKREQAIVFSLRWKIDGTCGRCRYRLQASRTIEKDVVELVAYVAFVLVRFYGQEISDAFNEFEWLVE